MPVRTLTYDLCVGRGLQSEEQGTTLAVSASDLSAKLSDYFRSRQGPGLLGMLVQGNVGDTHVELCRQQALDQGDGEAAAICAQLCGLRATRRNKAVKVGFALGTT